MLVMVQRKNKYAAWTASVTVMMSASVNEFCIPQRSLLLLQMFWCKIYKLLFPFSK